MSIRTEPITPALLREWTLPAPGESKYSRGQVIVIGGAAGTPGAAMLSGIAALRVGAGRLTLAVARSVAPHVAVAIPESGVVPLDESDGGSVRGAALIAATDDIAGADAVLVGPGLDDADEARELLERMPPLPSSDAILALDAFALGVLRDVPAIAEACGGRLVLSPNTGEAARLLDADPSDDPAADALRIAEHFGAVVTYSGVIAAPDGRVWASGTGHGGLATSGSGDVLSGAIVGLCARGASVEQAAVWATHAHAASGDRLSVRVGPLGFLARELLDELPRVIVEVESGAGG